MRKRRGRGKRIWRNRPEQTRSDAHTSPMQEEAEAGRGEEYSEEQINYQDVDSPFWTQLKLQQSRGRARLQAGMSAGQSPQPCSTTAPRCPATGCCAAQLRAMGSAAAICHSALSLGQGSPPDRRRVWINSRWWMVILNYRGLYNFKYYQPHLASENSHLVLNEAVIRTAWLNRWCPI